MLALALLVFGNTVVGILINLLIFGITTDDDESDDSDSDDSGEYSLPELTYKQKQTYWCWYFIPRSPTEIILRKKVK